MLEQDIIGKKKIINKQDWSVKFYQLDEFDMVTPISYQVVDVNDSLISGRSFLAGTDANKKSIEEFYVEIQDSILCMLSLS